jgi:predicted nucleotidyltransferase
MMDKAVTNKTSRTQQLPCGDMTCFVLDGRELLYGEVCSVDESPGGFEYSVYDKYGDALYEHVSEHWLAEFGKVPNPTDAAVALRTRIKERLTAVLDVANKHGVENVRIFGSVARGDARADSDIDILVDRGGFSGYLADFIALQDELSEILQTNVDLVFSDTVKQNRRPYIFGGELMCLY